MTAWITVTPRLRKGLDIMDEVNLGKFRLLVNRICQSLQTSNDGNIFSPEEIEKLSVSFDLDQINLSLFLDTITLIYTQAAFHVVKSASMESLMKASFGIQDEKIDIILQAWTTHAKGIVENLRQKSIFPIQVNEINWSLNIQAASMAISADTRPTVMLQLGLNDTSRKQSPSSMTIEMDKPSLLELYNNLETIQSQLDSLQ